MGMFDKLYINTQRLPLSRAERKRLGNDPGWQTKDLDCILTEVYITDEGELKVNHWEYESVPRAERAYPDEEGRLGNMGSLRRVNQRLEVIPTTDTSAFIPASMPGMAPMSGLNFLLNLPMVNW